MALSCVLWDFGDTLADERWMLEAPPGVPDWPRVWAEVAGGELADAWNRGEISGQVVTAAIAARLSMSEEEVAAHTSRCCARIRFFDLPWSIARRRRFPQALVTINPDGFSEAVVPRYGLAEVFHAIVTSWQERTLDKGVLGLTALARLGGELRPENALMIDNKEHNLESWERHGGRGYLFRGEAAFRRDLDGELRDLVFPG